MATIFFSTPFVKSGDCCEKKRHSHSCSENFCKWIYNTKPLTSAFFHKSSKISKNSKFGVWDGSVTFSNIWLPEALQNFSEQLWPCRLFSKQSPDFTEGVEKRIVAIGPVENDLETKPLTRAVFHKSSKISKKFKIWSLRWLSDFFKHLASRGLTKLFRAAMTMPFLFKTISRLHRRCRKKNRGHRTNRKWFRHKAPDQGRFS